MTRFAIIAGIGAALAATPAAAMTEQQCAISWSQADTNNDGVLTDTEATQVFAALKIKNIAVADGRLTKAAYLEHCKAGIFDTARLSPGAPLKGANSFTETQAKRRIVAAGFANVSALQKDADGVWRGTASDGRKSVTVAVDFRGNVVTD